jgi:two-component system CheB/CheR fusion protein
VAADPILDRRNRRNGGLPLEEQLASVPSMVLGGLAGADEEGAEAPRGQGMALLAEAFKSSPLRTLAAALCVTVGSFLGARLGTELQFPGIGAATLFPPYAVLTAALLLSEPRRWWVYLLASSLGNLLPHLWGGFSVSFVLLAELANYARALVAAAGVRIFGGRTYRFDTLSETVWFMFFAVLVGPVVGALLGAGDVVVHGAGEFWGSFQAWLLSNSLTGLTLLPILVVTVHNGRVAPETARRRTRAFEAAVLGISLLVVGTYSLTQPHVPLEALPTRILWLLPFLLWGAVRFGPRGTAAALLGIASLTIWGALHGRGPFAGLSPAENLLQLQLFLITISVPILLLSVLIQQQRQTEAALRQSREQFRCVVEDQTELICRYLPDGRCTFVNGAFCRYFQRAAGELVGKAVLHLPVSDIDENYPTSTHETHVPGPGGQPRWQQWTDRALFDERHQIVEWQSVGQDITEHKQAEDERRQLEAHRHVELALRQADRRKNEFIAVLSHELRNPLAPIGMALEVLKGRPTTDSDSLRAQGIIARQVGHLTRLVEDLLEISRITHGKIRLQTEIVEIGHVVAQAVEVAKPAIEAKRHELSLSIPVEPISVHGDPVRLVQVVANLLNNAARYTDPQGRIELRAVREGEYVRLAVRDNGIGIAQDKIGQVFDLFSQVGPASGGPQGGLGIGLTLVKQLVQLHGGEVEAQSQGFGQGTEIILRLPALSASIGSTLQAAETLQEPPTPLCILVVDDNADIAEGLTQLLTIREHTVHVASDGPSALEALARTLPDVVFLDLGLPGMSGLEVGRRMRQTLHGSRVLLVAISGFGQEEDFRQTRSAGFDHHLVKPFEMKALDALLSHFARPKVRSDD